MAESDRLPNTEEFMQRYESSKENALSALSLLSHYVKQPDIDDLEERIQEAFVGFHVAFVLNRAVNVGRCCFFFPRPFWRA